MTSIQNFIFSTCYLIALMSSLASLVIFIFLLKISKSKFLALEKNIEVQRTENSSKLDNLWKTVSVLDWKEAKTVSMVTPEMERKFDEVIHGVRKLTDHIHTMENKIGDLNMRVTIAEVRLEERKIASPQMLLPPPPAPAKRGRKPKIQ